MNLTDVETCYKVVRAELLQRFPLTAGGLNIGVDLTARRALAGAQTWELPISYRGRSYAEGKNITWRDGLAAVLHTVRSNLVPPPGAWRNP